MNKVLPFTVVCLFVVAVLGRVRVAEAVSCNPVELSSCSGAITSGMNPSSICCNKLKQQEACLCGYIKNPALGPYVNSPGTKRVASKCGVPIPSC
ncbi:hypothetical protein IC582_016128 [Cucumis melo]